MREGHSLLAVSMDFRIRENDGRGCFPSFPRNSVANASSCLPALTHPALISRLIPCNSVFVRGKCISFGLFASLFRVNPWQMPFLC